MKIHRKEVASAQLTTAISLFLNNIDLSSAITLAGAASNILTQLVLNEGKTPFIDFAREVCAYKNRSKIPSREKYNHFIDKLLGISFHKHMSDKCRKTISLDLEKCALYAITRAVADYISLYGQEENFIRAFLQWTYKHRKDEVMEVWKDMPEKFKKQLRKRNDSKSP